MEENSKSVLDNSSSGLHARSLSNQLHVSSSRQSHTITKELPLSDNESISRKTDNGKWSKKIESTAFDIGEKSKSYKIMHVTAAQLASTRYNIFSILNLLQVVCY